MPTGYTAPIYEGKDITLTEFAAGCARAFGAFMHQRDDGSGSELRYPEPPDNSYYREALEKAEIEFTRWNSLTEEQKYAEWSEYFNKQTVELHESVAKNSELRARYEAMLAKVHAVDVPSSLQNFKNFMVEQLTDSVKFDCGDTDKFERDYYQPQDYSTWSDSKNTRVRRDVTYYTEELTKEQERYNSQVAYIDTMRDTFGFDVKENTDGN